MVKNLPAVQETWVRFLGQEDLLEIGMATHSSIIAWRISWMEKPGDGGHKEYSICVCIHITTTVGRNPLEEMEYPS